MSHKQISQEQSYHHVCMQQISQKSYPHYVCRSVSSHTTSMYAADQSGEVIPPVCMQISQDKSYHQYICSISVRSIRATSMYAADRSVRSSHTTSMYAAVQSGASIPPVIKKQPQQQMSNEQQYHIYVCSSRIRSSHACMQHQISQEQSYCQYICSRSDISSNTNIIYIYAANQ